MSSVFLAMYNARLGKCLHKAHIGQSGFTFSEVVAPLYLLEYFHGAYTPSIGLGPLLDLKNLHVKEESITLWR